MNAIYAVALDGAFAMSDGSLPWKGNACFLEYAKADMERFKSLTSGKGKVVIMGFNTYTTFLHPLKNRVNLVIKKESVPKEISLSDSEFQFFPSIEEALNAASFFRAEDIFLIGGKKIFDIAFEKSLVDGIVFETVFPGRFPKAEIFMSLPKNFTLMKSEKKDGLIFNEYRNQVSP